MDETEAGEAGTAGAAGGRDGAAGAWKRRRGEGEGGDDGAEGADGAVAARLTAGDDDGVRATCDEACDNDRGAATGSGHRMACTLRRAVLQMCHSLCSSWGGPSLRDCSPGRTAFVFWQRCLFLRKNQTGTSAERVHTYHTTQRVGCMVQALSDEGENYKD